ncbi:MAG: response regulator transcription factor [Anaerolineae bacterium]
MTKIRILLADDHAVLRAGLKLLINSQEDMQAVGEARTGLETIQVAKEARPDVILLDLSMPEGSGLDVLSILKAQCPQSRILVLTMHTDEDYLKAALRMGAAGYVVKSAADQELLSAIRAVHRGQIYLDPSMTRSLLEDLISPSVDTFHDPWDELSEREQQVISEVARGYTNREIADRLHLSVKTVETYRARAMDKLGLRTRAQLVEYAMRRGLLQPPSENG